MKRVRGGLALAIVLVSAWRAIGCDDTESYVYSAQKYDTANMCVSAYAPVEVVQGSGAGIKCAPTCLMVGSDLFVSTMCPPIPTTATAVDDTDPTCIAAATAQGSAGTCDMPADAGSPAIDASTDAPNSG